MAQTVLRPYSEVIVGTTARKYCVTFSQSERLQLTISQLAGTTLKSNKYQNNLI
jgi:hypothetical protein